jgi:predicted nucleotidyltransferase
MQPRERDEIIRLCQEIVRAVRPDRVILFGSHADGMPTAGSDVDLLVIMPYQGSARLAAAAILQQVRPDFGVDLLVRTPAEIDRRLAMDDPFIREIVQRGDVLYEADHARVG